MAMRLALSFVEAAVLPCRHSVARRGDRVGRRIISSKLSVLSVAAQLLLLSPASGRPKVFGGNPWEAPRGYRRLTSLRCARAIALDVALGVPEAAMASEQLNVADGTARSGSPPRSEGDEGAPSRMRRAALQAELGVESLEPVHDAAGTQSLATFRLDDVAFTAWSCG